MGYRNKSISKDRTQNNGLTPFKVCRSLKIEGVRSSGCLRILTGRKAERLIWLLLDERQGCETAQTIGINWGFLIRDER